jgi:hypothetical protein
MVHGVDDLARVDPLQIDRGDPEVCMPELALNDWQRDALVRHLDCGSMPELVRRKAPTHPSLGRQSAKLTARGGRRPGFVRGTV